MELWKNCYLWMTMLLLAKSYLFRLLLYRDANPWNLLLAEAGWVLLFVLCIALLFSRWRTAAFVSGNLLVSVYMLAVVMYFSYYGKVMTYHALFQLGQVGQVGASVASLMKPSYLLLFADLLLYLAVLKWINQRQTGRFRLSRKHLLVLGTLLLLFSVERAKAQHSADIVNDRTRAQQMGLFAFQISSVWDSSTTAQQWKPVSYDTVQSLKGEKPAGERPPLFAAAKGKNVIVIQLEAFQRFLIGLRIGGQEVTPHLNQLVNESIFFPYVFQQIGQGNTSDAEFISNTSLYPIGDRAMSQAFGDRVIPSLPRLLKPLGYESMTFHVNNVDYWNRDELYPALGFDRYYDKSFFGKEDVIGLGASDDVLFSKAIPVLEELHKRNQPFYAQFVTLSGHHPFQLPPEREELTLPEEAAGTMAAGYLQTQHYVDQALGRFFDELKRTGLWDDTVIVLYGDHLGLPDDDEKQEEQAFLQKLLNHEYDTIDAFNIPLIIKLPGNHTGKRVEQVGGQMDIMPTVANLIGLDLTGHVHFGRNLLAAGHNLLPQRFYLPEGSFFNDEILFIPGEGFADGTAISIKTRQRIADLQKYQADYQRVRELLSYSDSYMNLLPYRY